MCPRCGCEGYSWHSTRHLCQCSACKYQASVTSGTIFHRTRTPLRKWFWMMGHKIRKAMADRDSQYKIGGVVEMDDAFIGPRKPGKRGRGAEGKTKFIVAVGRRGDRPGFATMERVEQVGSEEAVDLATRKVEPAGTIVTDGWRAYRRLGKHGFAHEHVVLMNDKKLLKELRWVHVLIANLKGSIRGVYHDISSKHLQRYLAEFCYRFNRRFWQSELFDRTIAACLVTRTVTYAELRA